MILLIDNYDSFSYNLYQLIGSLEPDIKVIRNDAMTVEEIAALAPRAIVLSPGPGRPANAGVCEDVIRQLGPKIPILGVCLGHQAICEAFGATISYAKELMHGKQSMVRLAPDCPLFRGLPAEIPVARYHSLAAVDDTLPDCLQLIAHTEDGEVMAVRHREYPIFGLQFHPESVLTPDGRVLLRNFLNDTGAVEHPLPIDDKERRIFMLEAAIKKLRTGEDLSYDEAYGCMDEIMSGKASQVQTTAFLCLLGSKGETIEELSACAAGMRDKALPVAPHQDTLEIVGTGGDGANTFNISTTAAIVIAAAGQPVAKHGNRAASSRSGAADCLEALGVNLQQEPDKAVQLLDEIGICFFYAQKYHAAMKYVGPIRKELGIRTVFNSLGPLTNPAKPIYQVMGVYSEAVIPTMAEVLPKLGVQRGLVVHARDCLDEISSSCETVVCEFTPEGKRTYTITPEEFGLTRCQKSDLVGGSPEDNARITRDILAGKPGPQRDTVLMNAGAALYISGKADSIAAGIALAAQAIDSGKAASTLESFIASSNR